MLNEQKTRSKSTQNKWHKFTQENRLDASKLPDNAQHELQAKEEAMHHEPDIATEKHSYQKSPCSAYNQIFKYQGIVKTINK